MGEIAVGCDYKECFVPPALHRKCAAADISRCWPFACLWIQHQHVPKRSQGGEKAVVMLCAGHHDNIDNGTRYEGLRLSNRVVMGMYMIENRDTGQVLLELEVTE